jgi:hypothetical protein
MRIVQKLWLIYWELTWIHTTLHSVKKVGDTMILRANVSLSSPKVLGLV